MSARSVVAGLVDSVLEATIVGSFTKLGYGARRRVLDWSPVSRDLTGLRIVLTGGSGGIGQAVARALVGLGAEVHLTSRSRDRADETAEEIGASGPGRAIGHALDTADADSILAFVETIAALDGGIDVLLNNAGALSPEYQTDPRGMELTLSSHLVGPYLLMTELRDRLNPGAQVVFMSSGGMYTQRLDVESIEMSEAEYSGTVAYARAKRGQVELVAHLAPRWAPEVILHAMHPGWVDTPGIEAGIPGFGKVMGPLLRSAEQGADTMIWLAATGGEGARPGRFWHDREPRRTVYLPRTATTDAERERLVAWLERTVAPARRR